jgi:hypothetical protein
MRSDPNQPVSPLGQPVNSADNAAGPGGDYSERLSPSATIWGLGLAFGAGLGLIPGPVSTTAAFIVAIVGVVAVITVLLVTTPRLLVTEDRFVAGRAQVPLSLVAAVEPLTAQQSRALLGVDLDARAYLCTRAWISRGAKVTLRDPEDPTPYWLVSSRHPEALAAAVNSRLTGADRRD